MLAGPAHAGLSHLGARGPAARRLHGRAFVRGRAGARRRGRPPRSACGRSCATGSALFPRCAAHTRRS
jgi:hypothetical protein